MDGSARSRGQEAMEVLRKRLVEIKFIQRKFTLRVLVFNAILYLAILAVTRSFDAANKIYTNTFQYQAVAWCCWFMLPYFLRVEAKQDAGMAMAHDSVDLLAKVDAALERRMERLDRLFDRLEEAVDRADRGEHPLVKKLSLDFREVGDTIRNEVAELRKAFTKPIVPPARRIEPAVGVLEGARPPKGNGS